MPKKITKISERELGSLMTTWFNDEIKRNKFPFTFASNEVKVKTINF